MGWLKQEKGNDKYNSSYNNRLQITLMTLSKTSRILRASFWLTVGLPLLPLYLFFLGGGGGGGSEFLGGGGSECVGEEGLEFVPMMVSINCSI